MSDSDDDLMPNSVLKYPDDPAINNTNITSCTFRNNMMTSTFNMPHLERQRYGMRGFDQRSMYYRRETSPMSLRSFPNSGVQNFHNSFYGRGTSSLRSVCNGRSGSPVSVRSIDSNASVTSATDIALAFKTAKFNKYDIRLIKDAYNKFMKNRHRKRIEKRRNLKLFRKGNRRRSGEDSGEQGSDSSISSDDCRSSRTIIHKENIPKTIPRPFKTHDLSQFRTSMKESDMYKDCTENLKQNSLRNMFAVNMLSHIHTPQEKTENASVTLKERFTKGTSFLLPSQRFNKSKLMNDMSLRNAIPENTRNTNNHVASESNRNHETDSDKEEIFSKSTVRSNSTQQSTTLQRKRVHDAEELNLSDRKRNKTAISPIKENDCSSIDINNQKSDFIFKKPKMPVRKTSNVKKDSVPEILIAKSRQPLIGNLELDLLNNKSQQNPNFENRHVSESQNKELVQNTTEIEQDCSNQEVTQNSTEVSMKPSFLKRKLFTQKLDVAESKNISSDNLATNSPQTKIYSSCREKNKVRKLVSSQSYLSRDVLGDDNVLDLIHKIVPPDQMNITSATNKKELSKSNNDNNNKWDVASVISMCNNDEGSDTYTDEEIFRVSQIGNKTNNKLVNKETDKLKPVKSKVTEPEMLPKDIRNSKKMITDCMVVVQKLQPNNCKQDTTKLTETQCLNKRTVSNCVKSFWDTDESDMEDRSAKPWALKYHINQGKNPTNNCTNLTLNKINKLKGTILTVRSSQNKGINSSTRSDISRVSKRKDPDHYPEKQEENNNKIVNKNTKTKQNEEKNINNTVAPSTKIQKDSKLKSDSSKENNEKLNSKPKKTKETKNNKQQQNNKCNISRESIRLKQKREKVQINSITQVNDSTPQKKRGRKPKNSTDKRENCDSINNKNNNTVNKKSKETSNKDTKSVKNPIIKNATLNRTRQHTPRKCKEKKQLFSSADQSSLNISNISSRSLRIGRKNVK